MARTALLAALLALAPPPAGAQDLLQVYRQARVADPVLASADAARHVVREGVSQARAPLLPQLTANLDLGETRVSGEQRADANLVDGNRSRNLSARLDQVLVDMSALARLGASHAAAEAQDAAYRAAEQALCIRVATAYFDVLTAEDAVAHAESNEAAFAQQVEHADLRHRTGLSALVDLEQARVYHASARSSTIAARKALADAREALAEITGSSPGVLLGLREALPMDAPQPSDPQAWVRTALERNPLLQAQASGLEAAEQRVRAERAGHLPTLSARVSVGRDASWPMAGTNDGRSITTAGLVLSVPLSTGGAQQSLVRRALHQREGLRSDLEAQRRRVAREVLDRYRGVIAGIEQTEITRAGVEAARKALASTRAGQGLGTQTMNDLLLAIQNLASAQRAHSLARHQFVLSRLQLLQAAGDVSEADLAVVNALLQ